AKPHDEASLSRVTLSADQVKSLDLRTEAAASHKVQEQRRLTGWIVAPQGNEVTLTAPVAGYVRDPKKASIPLVGTTVEAGKELLSIDPVLTPLEYVQLAALKRTIDGDVRKADESVKVAKAEQERVKELYDKSLRSEQDLEQANAKLALAQEDHKAALDKQKLFALGTAKH